MNYVRSGQAASEISFAMNMNKILTVKSLHKISFFAVDFKVVFLDF